MKLIVLHLSDIHFDADYNKISDKYKKIADAVRMTDGEAEHLEIVVSGDIANRGALKEYTQAQEFFKSLQDYLYSEKRFKFVSWNFTPGNHDCDFSNIGGLRASILESHTKKFATSFDDEIVETLLKVQKKYRDFVSSFTGRNLHPENDVYTYKDLKLENKTVRFVSLNTALCSSNPEAQGDLRVPTNRIALPDDTPNAVITFFHHPYGWLESNNAREFKKLVESISDIVLTGHEHESGLYSREDFMSGAHTLYVEGSVLQSGKGRNESGFNVIVLNLKEALTKSFFFRLNEQLYTATDPNPEWQEFRRNKIRLESQFEIDQSYIERFLSDPGAGFTNARKGKLRFDDIFVPGHLEEITKLDERRDLVTSPISMGNFSKYTEKSEKLLIIGEEQSGKTSFAKFLYNEYHNLGFVPVFIRASTLKEKDLADERLTQIVIETFSDQYSPSLQQEFLQLPREKKILLVDDAHLSPFNQKGMSKFIEQVSPRFGKVILFSHALSLIDEVSAADENYLADFSQFEVKEFNNQLRELLIERWFLVGKEFTFDETELERTVVRTKVAVDQILGKNLLPSFPIFILIILQQMEAHSTVSTSNGAHGYLYESLITTALARTNAKLDLDTCYTFLSMLAESMFVQKTRFVSEEDFVNEFNNFCTSSKQTIRLERMEKPLVDANILIEHDGKYWFRYKYCYYYFAARYLSDRLRSKFGQDRLHVLAGEVYREEYANILMFLAYLSNKDPSIIDVMLTNARKVYEGVPTCDFKDHVAFVTKMHSELPKLVLLDRKSNEARAENNKRIDEIEHKSQALEDTDDFNDTLQMNLALKTIQVLGQLLKNFPSSLDGEIKFQIADECYQLGLRTMTRFVTFADENKEGIIALFDDWLGKLATKETELSLKPKAEQFVAFLVEAFSTAVIRRISSSVGVPTLAPLYEEIRKKHNGLPVDIIDFSIKLDHFERFPMTELDFIIKEAKGNIFPVIMLRRLAIDHFERFPAQRSTKQSACQKLQIELKHMQLLENRRNKG